MSKSWFLFAFLAVSLLCQAPKAVASVGGQLEILCGSTGTLYSNLTPSVTIHFEMSLTNFSSECSFSISWTDSTGHAQSVTVGPNLSTIVSSSLPSGKAVSWSSPPLNGNQVVILWELERAPAHSVGLPSNSTFTPVNLYGTPCGSSGTLYANLTASSVSLDLGMNFGFCDFTVSWTDASGHAHTFTPPGGVSTTVPAGGVISWSSTSGSGNVGAAWSLERVVTTKLW